MFGGMFGRNLAMLTREMDVSVLRRDVIANNVANADTPGYKPQQVTLIPMNPGVAVGPIIASTQASVDIGSELVNLIVAKQAYAAAAKVVSAANQMTQDLLQAI